VKVTAKGARGRSLVTNAALGKRADVQQLELAALVASQAIKKNASYAPIYNTLGLVQNELGQVNGAVASFANAAKLDPKFFEAQMNYAAVNLGFRGFKQAEDAYRKALDMHPNDYDAHLGLALALRGQIDNASPDYEKLVNAVQGELDACKKLAADRPEVYYNEGILTQEFKAKAGGGKDKTIAALTAAKGIFQQFVDKASDKPEYAGAVKRSKERIEDIDKTVEFLNLPGDEQKSTPPPAPAGSGATPAPAGGAGAAPAPAAPADKK
jgi:tetratricopeptide (TPR) repeat protein